MSKWVKLVKAGEDDVIFKYFGPDGTPYSWSNLDCKNMDIVEFKEYLRTTSPSDIEQNWGNDTGSPERAVYVHQIGKNKFRIKLLDVWNNTSYLEYVLPKTISEEKQINEKTN